MTTLEKARWLTSKEVGAGVSVQTLAKYANCHYSTISHFINETKPISEKLKQEIEQGIYKWLAEVKNKLEEK